MSQHQDVFRAIADPTRRAIIGLLAQQDMSVNAIASHFEMSRPGIAKHLSILKDGAIISVQARGRERVHSLRPERLKVITDWVEHYSNFWDAKLSDLKTTIETPQ